MRLCRCVNDEFASIDIRVSACIQRTCCHQRNQGRIRSRSLFSCLVNRNRISEGKHLNIVRNSNLENAASDAFLIIKYFIEAKKFGTPIHDDSLKFSTCGTCIPLSRKNDCASQLCNLTVINFNRSLTLKPGLAVLVEYKSPSMPSKVFAVGKYAKKEGCCHIVKPENTQFIQSRQKTCVK